MSSHLLLCVPFALDSLLVFGCVVGAGEQGDQQRTNVRGEASHHGNHSIHIIKRKRRGKTHYFTHQHNSCSTYPSYTKIESRVLYFSGQSSKCTEFYYKNTNVKNIWCTEIVLRFELSERSESHWIPHKNSKNNSLKTMEAVIMTTVWYLW